MKPRTAADFKAAHDPATIIARLSSEVEKARKESDEVAAVRAVLTDLGVSLATVTPPRWSVKPAKHAESPGIPTLFLSDLHWGERVDPAQIGGVNEYGLATARRRLRYCVETAISLCRILDPKMRYPGIFVPLGGDLISGNIHDELTATNELNSMPAVLDLFGELCAVIGILADAFGAVTLPCVSGNHGRDTRKIWAKDRHHTSFDWLICKFLEQHFAADKRVTFLIPDGPDAAYSIYGTRYLLTHGDQFRAGDSIIGPIGPIFRGDQKKRARNAQVAQSYDVMLAGHWHTYMHTPRIIVNGSLKGLDEYAFAGNFGFEPPQQALWITHPRKGITFRMPVFCEPPRP